MPALKRTDSCVDIAYTLKQVFKKNSFRPHQKEIIEAVLDGHDVYVQAATSFGKSLCFQLPAVIGTGVTIVISPLISLMRNQIEALQSLNISACALNSSGTLQERNTIYKDLASGHPRIRLLYVTPELCSGDRFRDLLRVVHKQNELVRIAIDEAHCISEWGHDFRKDFKRLSWFRETFPDVPIICLTATANSRVRQDIFKVLKLDAESERVKSFVMSPQRGNLHLEIRYTNDDDDRLHDFLDWIRGVYGRRRTLPRRNQLEEAEERAENVSGIIYTISRDECEKLAADLRAEGIGAKPYHAKLSNETKDHTLQRWEKNEIGYDIIVATTAFGMGIDKNNVRFVVHWRLPKSFEGYYQEAGRAGRDGDASYCFLYYSREDLERVTRMVRKDSHEGSSQTRVNSLTALAMYCENTRACRHAEICKYFGETNIQECDFACDWHKDAEDLQDRFRRGLASEEFVSTQALQGTYDDGYYIDY